MMFLGRRSIATGLVFFMLLFMAGCAQYEEELPDKNSIVVHADQSADVTMYRTFDQSYYSEDELVAMVEEELAEYNGSHGEGSISLKSHSLDGQKVSLTLHFRTWEDYDRYMLDRIYIGTVQGAYDERYDFNQALSYANNKEHAIGRNDLMGMADDKIVVVAGDYSIQVPGKIRYYTQGMKLIDAKTVQSAEEGLYFIIY